MRRSRLILIILILPWSIGTGSAQVFHATGDYYAGTAGIWGFDEGNRLYDDGAHDDGEAGDGIHAGFVISDQPPGPYQFKIATKDWSEAYPSHPEHPLANAVLYTFEPGAVIHFRLDTNALAGWQPEANAVACSHFSWPEFPFELIGGPPELGSWDSGVPAVFQDGMWQSVVGIAEAGEHEYKFRVADTWDICNLGIHYNMFIGDNFSFTQEFPGTIFRFQFNPSDGRSRVIDETTALEGSSWGSFKSLYR